MQLIIRRITCVYNRLSSLNRESDNAFDDSSNERYISLLLITGTATGLSLVFRGDITTYILGNKSDLSPCVPRTRHGAASTPPRTPQA